MSTKQRDRYTTCKAEKRHHNTKSAKHTLSKSKPPASRTQAQVKYKNISQKSTGKHCRKKRKPAGIHTQDPNQRETRHAAQQAQVEDKNITHRSQSRHARQETKPDGINKPHRNQRETRHAAYQKLATDDAKKIAKPPQTKQHPGSQHGSRT